MHLDEDVPVSRCAVLFEPVARRLGDLCSCNSCSRRRDARALPAPGGYQRRRGPGRRAPAGGTARAGRLRPIRAHQLSAALDYSILSNAGWHVRREWPADANDLHDMVSSQRFDTLVLSLSTAFHRTHRLPGLARMIAGVRRASSNPDLTIVISGRIFVDRPSTGHRIGADVVSRTAAGIERIVLGGDRARADRMTLVG